MTLFLDTSIISFYISLLGIMGMITFKARELKSGKRSFISKLSDRTNHIVHDYYDKVVTLIKFINRRSALAFVQWIAYHVLTWARNLYIWAYKKAHAHAPSKKVIDMVRGKGEVNRNSGSSFYLKSISGKNIEEAIEMKK
jgi:hypothetical protein